jgi:hypothetical protein
VEDEISSGSFDHVMSEAAGHAVGFDAPLNVVIAVTTGEYLTLVVTAVVEARPALD